MKDFFGSAMGFGSGCKVVQPVLRAIPARKPAKALKHSTLGGLPISPETVSGATDFVTKYSGVLKLAGTFGMGIKWMRDWRARRKAAKAGG